MVLGGSGSDISAATSEILQYGHFSFGPEPPEVMKDHCVMTINDTQIFMTGSDSNGRNSAYIFNIETTEWIQLPNLPTPRTGASCGLVNNTEVFVVGGYNGSIDITTVESFSLETMEWTTRDEFPNVQGYHSGTVPYGDTFIITGGETVTLLEKILFNNFNIKMVILFSEI